MEVDPMTSPRIVAQILAAVLVVAAAPLAADPIPDARSVATQEEMTRMVTAEEGLGIFTDLYTTLENLDDTANSPGNPARQYINDGGGALVMRTGEGLPFRRFLTSEWDFQPSINYEGALEGSAGDYDEGTPLDKFLSPHPYYLYSPLGLVEPKTGNLSLRYYGDRFSRWTIVSHGPDGEFDGGDDLTLSFGPAVTARTISSARLRNATAKAAGGYQLVVRGFNLGAIQGTGGLLYNGTNAAGATTVTWTATQVVFALSTEPPAGAAISLRLDGGTTTRSVSVVNELAPTAAEGWEVYE